MSRKLAWKFLKLAGGDDSVSIESLSGKLFSKEEYLLSDWDNRTVSPDEDLSAVNVVLGRTEVRIYSDSTGVMLLAGNQETWTSLDKPGDI